ncbi:zinc finger MYM-type protein 1-like [Aphis craccivora]|uniref:Zinc finger MYM-type protein 1-like n=1 Tax=Aphis craccivora TaxID=307492 RepID=A0A6G0Y3Q0_APHCR|nr:zinc finger MYM-type protein 1-like [Aphis craccivora]
MAAKNKRLKTLHDFFMPKKTKKNSGDNDPDDPVSLAHCSLTVEEFEKITESNTVHELLDPDDPANLLPVFYVKLDRAFCFSCRMFTNSSGINAGYTDSAYSKVGLNNWKLATTKAHQTSNTHLNSVTSLTNFLHLKPIDTVLDEKRELIHSQKEQQRLKNRQIMQRLIDITLCIGIGGRSFRGKNEKESSYNKGLFKDIVTLLAKYDPLLKSHLELGPKNATYCSNIIQNDLIISISQVLKNQLKHKIENKKISIIADETSDLGHHEQLSIVLRYFDDEKKCPVEQFVGMKRIMSTDSQNIFNAISDVINDFGIKWKSVLSMWFDGAATMSGSVNGVQAKFKKENDKAFFLIYSFIEGCRTRHGILETIANSLNLKLKTLKSVSTTRWACRAEAVSAIKENYTALLVAIKEISDRTNFKSKSSQSSNINLLTAVELVTSLKQSLISLRNTEKEFQDIFKKTVQMCNDNDILIPDLKRRRVSYKIDKSHKTQHIMKNKEEEMKISVFFPMLDRMISDIEIKFNQETINMIKCVARLIKQEVTNDDLINLSNIFGVDFNDLDAEIRLLKSNCSISKDNINTCDDLIKWLADYGTGRDIIFQNIFIILKEFVTISVTSCSCERTFSELNFIKTKLKSTIQQDRLDALLKISIEQGSAYNINIDDVIEHFKILKPINRRMEL